MDIENNTNALVIGKPYPGKHCPHSASLSAVPGTRTMAL